MPVAPAPVGAGWAPAVAAPGPAGTAAAGLAGTAAAEGLAGIAAGALAGTKKLPSGETEDVRFYLVVLGRNTRCDALTSRTSD